MKWLTLPGLAAIAIMFSGSSMADANDSAKWSDVGPWQIRVDKTMNNGCFMMGAYPSQQMILRVGINNNNNSSYLIVGNPTWQSLESGKQYQVAGQFDGGSMEYWTATGIKLGNVTFLSVQFNSPSPEAVIQTFGQRLNFRLYYRGNILASMTLRGTAAAAAETINCNHQLGAIRTDPFGSDAPAQHPAVSTDPFARAL